MKRGAVVGVFLLYAILLAALAGAALYFRPQPRRVVPASIALSEFQLGDVVKLELVCAGSIEFRVVGLTSTALEVKLLTSLPWGEAGETFFIVGSLRYEDMLTLEGSSKANLRNWPYLRQGDLPIFLPYQAVLGRGGRKPASNTWVKPHSLASLTRNGQVLFASELPERCAHSEEGEIQDV